MSPTVPSSRSNVWVRMFWAIGIYLAFELGLFVIIKLVLRATASELVGPYLAFAIPMVVVMLLAWGLRRWEKHSSSPRWLALGWGLWAAVFVSLVTIAVVYSGVELRLINPRELDVFGVVCVVCVFLVAPVTAYRQAYRVLLKRISTSAANDTNGSEMKEMR